jgi:hypothetical protein
MRNVVISEWKINWNRRKRKEKKERKFGLTPGSDYLKGR